MTLGERKRGDSHRFIFKEGIRDMFHRITDTFATRAVS